MTKPAKSRLPFVLTNPQSCKQPARILMAAVACSVALSLSTSAQSTDATSSPAAPVPQVAAPTLRTVPADLLHDQKAIWTSPARLRTHDLRWLLPLAAATGAGIATDHRASTSVVLRDPGFNQANVNASNVLIGGFLAAPVALYGFGHLRDDAHAHEAAILSGEALLDGVVVEQGVKLLTFRERPALDNGRGLFFQSSAGVSSSFPSSHALLAWSEAAVLAGEYRSRWSRLGIYSLATGVSLTRVLGQEHFPSDVLVGSAAGWLIGHFVYRTRHVPDLQP